MSNCEIYFLPKGISEKFVMEIKKNHWKYSTENGILKILKDKKDFFLFYTDFDFNGGELHGEIYRINITIGNKLNEKIKEILLKFNE